MSFMFKPLAYDDMTAINRPKIDQDYSEYITKGNVEIAKEIVQEAATVYQQQGKAVILIDGYASANFSLFKNLINQILSTTTLPFHWIDMNDLYLSSTEIDALETIKESLPPKSEEDPVQLFGKLYHGNFVDLLQPEALAKVVMELKEAENKVFFIIGHGAADCYFTPYHDRIAYLDVTPKTTAIRAREGKYANIGDQIARPFAELMRRNYYVDFELIVNLRKRLLQQDIIDYYVAADHDEALVMLSKVAFNHILMEMTKYPFRCKPVYLDGIWGGEYIRKIRQLNQTESANIAWVFDMIPMEVSIVIAYREMLLEFPFSTFFQKYPREIMGKDCTERFNSYFPIRCNYDDTYHSDGNMSIQIHPNQAFTEREYREKGSQDEAYYVVATGHGAKTYVGFNEDADTDEFFRLAAVSAKEGTEVEYQKYINHIDSVPGRQIMLPAGTVHSSGQNQLILELGSLTIGSYTYKLYDYNRKDKEGNPRPIHLKNGQTICDTSRRTNWVNEHIAIEPYLLSGNEEYQEWQVGKTELMYYETRRVDIKTHGKATFQNQDQFTIISLVDGEHACVYDATEKERCYHQNYLDIIVVPASIREYTIENTGYQPIVAHKVMLKK